MRTLRCPESIVRLFADEDSINEGRYRAAMWLDAQDLERGDQVWMPHPEDGRLVGMTFTEGEVVEIETSRLH